MLREGIGYEEFRRRGEVGLRMEDLSAIIAASNNVIETTLDLSARFPGHGPRMLMRVDLSVNPTTLHDHVGH